MSWVLSSSTDTSQGGGVRGTRVFVCMAAHEPQSSVPLHTGTADWTQHLWQLQAGTPTFACIVKVVSFIVKVEKLLLIRHSHA